MRDIAAKGNLLMGGGMTQKLPNLSGYYKIYMSTGEILQFLDIGQNILMYGHMYAPSIHPSLYIIKCIFIYDFNLSVDYCVGWGLERHKFLVHKD